VIHPPHAIVLAIAACLSLNCARANPRSVSHAAGPTAATDYCAMSVAALKTAIKSHEEAPDGLDPSCVREYATVNGKIYVDARFMSPSDLEIVPQRICARDRFVVRFDFKQYEQSPGRGVLFLSVKSPTREGRDFYLTVEQSNWTTRSTGMLAVPPCYPAFGILRQSPKTCEIIAPDLSRSNVIASQSVFHF
jgi:hypothetical protein